MKINNLFAKFGKINVGVTILLGILIGFMSVGYALNATEVKMLGRITIDAPTYEVTGLLELNSSSPEIKITNEDISDGKNIRLKLSEQATDRRTFTFTLYNGTTRSYTYLGNDFFYQVEDIYGNDIIINYPGIEGLVKGDIIEPGERVDITLKFYVDTNDLVNIDSEGVLTFKEGEYKDVVRGKIIGHIGDIVANTDGTFDVQLDLANLYDCSRELAISLGNENLEIVEDANILLNKDEEKDIHIKVKFRNDTVIDTTTSISLIDNDGILYHIGNVNFNK